MSKHEDRSSAPHETGDTVDTEQELMNLRFATSALALLTEGLVPRAMGGGTILTLRDAEGLDWLARELRERTAALDDAFHDQRLCVQQPDRAGGVA